jgi:hypothetical protein
MYKIEFVERKDIDDTSWFFTQINGDYVSNSGSISREKAYSFFKKYIEQSNKKPVETVLETVEVENLVAPF